MPRPLALALIAAALAACYRNDSVLAPADRLAFGTWGGYHAQVTTSDSLMQVSLECSFGTFPGHVTLDSQGRFTINGTWNRSIGPIMVNGYMPAQFSGQVLGNELTFAIAVDDTIAKQVSSLGPATVVYGQQGTTEVCPV